MLVWEATRSSRLLWSRRWPDSGQYQSTWTVAWPAISAGTGFLPVGNRPRRFMATLLGAFPSRPCSSGPWHGILDWSAEQPVGLAPARRGQHAEASEPEQVPAGVAALPGPARPQPLSALLCAKESTLFTVYSLRYLLLQLSCAHSILLFMIKRKKCFLFLLLFFLLLFFTLLFKDIISGSSLFPFGLNTQII